MSAETDGLVQTIAAWGAAAGALVGSLALLRRRLSRDRTEVTKDQAEAQIIETALAERNEARAEARAAWLARTADVEAIARLTAQNAHQAGEISRLTKDFASFKKMVIRLYPETRTFLASDFQPLDPMRIRRE